MNAITENDMKMSKNISFNLPFLFGWVFSGEENLNIQKAKKKKKNCNFIFNIRLGMICHFSSIIY